MAEHISEETKDQVVKLYRAGLKTEAIMDETGVSRPMIYYILQARGVRPQRQKGRTAPLVTTNDLMEQLSAAFREIGRLEAECEKLRGQLDGRLDGVKSAATGNAGKPAPRRKSK